MFSSWHSLLPRYTQSSRLTRASKSLSIPFPVQYTTFCPFRTGREEDSLNGIFSCLSQENASLSAFYKEHTGENINTTVTRLRMEKAEFLLSTTALSITQIAMSTDYDNVSSFIRRFKQIYHMPPGAWRETHS